MSYTNAKNLLPQGLLKELQKYIQGELIYIPKNEDSRVPWGHNNGTRKNIKKRNETILKSYESGYSVKVLTETYNLSEDSIRKIILKTRRELQISI